MDKKFYIKFGNSAIVLDEKTIISQNEMSAISQFISEMSEHNQILLKADDNDYAIYCLDENQESQIMN